MSGASSEALLEALERHWGSREFRPLQKEIIAAVLDRRDVAVVMPTGGGKSLCYQMPALFLEGTAVVVSPLIALMQDQVAQLSGRGIPAAALNSSVGWGEQAKIQRELRARKLKLLYLAPERLLREDMIELLRQASVCYYAIDEAHCISEWGHEFRPEYRELRRLRQWHPEVPLLALTASATQRVRHDILAQLEMRDPAKFIRSFERPNLRYLALAADARLQWRMLEAALEAHRGASVIIYAATVAQVEETAAKLNARGMGAAAYHAQMPAEERRAAQQRWMAGSPAVLVGTLAFGMGIDKPDVRAVIHLSLPKSLEQYYQEAGRAGRDGLPGDCLLLWQKRDIGVNVHFLKQLSDAQERERAWRRYHDIRRYADATQCRHVAICRHFGQAAPSRICRMCDVCGAAPEWFEQARRSAESAPAGRWRAPAAADEETATKSPAGRRRAPAAPDEDTAATSPAGRRRAAAAPRVEKVHAELDAASETLFARLKAWRLETARRDGVPAYVVFPDAALRSIAALRPASWDELGGISGVGPAKLAKYGAAVIELVAAKRSS